MSIWKLLVVVVLLVSVRSACAEEKSASWFMDGKSGESLDGIEIRNDAGNAVMTGKGVKNSGTLAWDKDVPGKFIYDPLKGESRGNTASLRLKDGAHIEISGDPSSFTDCTIEFFARFDGDPQKTVPVLFKSRSSDAACELAIGGIFSSKWKQTYYGVEYSTGTGKKDELTTGHYVSIARIHDKTLGWRHLALVYSAADMTLGMYCDGYLKNTRKLDAPLKLDAGTLYVGAKPGGTGFSGLVDEVRISGAALKPHQFLRARNDGIKDVSFQSQATALPPDSGYVDLKECFGAVGDGKTDDTEALKKALKELSNNNPLAYNTLYIPPGTYLVSDMLRCSRFIIVQGAGRDKTIIKLKDNSAGFNNPTKPKPVVRASSSEGDPGSNKQVNGSSIGIYWFDFAIDTGKGNPGAKGIEYHSNNHGALMNAVISSGDGTGTVGLDLTGKTAGPSLIKNVAIRGFDYGITCKYQEYSQTLESIALERQKKAGIFNEANIMAMRKIMSKNAVPAIISKGGNSMITILDSMFEGGDSANFAMQCEGGLYARNVKTSGYKAALEKKVEVRKERKYNAPFTWETKIVDGPEIKEFAGDDVICPWGKASGSLKLPIEETPEVPWGDIKSDWVNIMKFENLVKDENWGPAIQAAIDSGARTVYFPWRRSGYPSTVQIHLRGKIERLFGMRSGIGRGKEDKSKEPLILYDDPNPQKTVVIERMEVGGIVHSSPGTLILLHTEPGAFRNAKGCGKLFIEDSCSSDFRFDYPQNIWARQWNVELHGEGPCIVSKGATIWSLGFKTEYESSKLWAENGAQTEILGAFIYPVNKGIPKDRPMFKNTDSRMALVFGTSVYSANHDLAVLDTQKGQVKETRTENVRQSGSRFRMDLYTSVAE